MKKKFSIFPHVVLGIFLALYAHFTFSTSRDIHSVQTDGRGGLVFNVRGSDSLRITDMFVDAGLATADKPGLVGTEAQTWAGAKQFSDAIYNGNLVIALSSSNPTPTLFTPPVGSLYIAVAGFRSGSNSASRAFAMISRHSSSATIYIHNIETNFLTFTNPSGSDVRLESSSSSDTGVTISWLRLY